MYICNLKLQNEHFQNLISSIKYSQIRKKIEGKLKGGILMRAWEQGGTHTRPWWGPHMEASKEEHGRHMEIYDGVFI